MKRAKHSLSHYTLSTFDMGRLIPVSNFEVLPGDSIRMSSSALLRLSPLMTPVMHPVNVRIHHWFVPYRVIWDGWEDFITGQSADEPPSINSTTAAGSLWDYLGVPPCAAGQKVSLLPIRAYNLIWNEFYRDQDLQTERAEDDYSTPARVAWEKDYFTAARPWTQKGGEVSFPLGVTAPVGTASARTITGAQPSLLWNTIAGNPNTDDGAMGVGSQGQTLRDSNGISGQAELYPANLFADLSSATAASVNDVRLAFALQRYQEARAQYGSRYTEYLRYLGVRSSDARLQRPEYLGGGKSTISFSEILRTGNESGATTAPIGEMKGHGIAALRTRRFIRFFEEHGVVLSLASVRPRSIYTDGLHRKFTRWAKEDYWQKELELIGQQEVYNREVRAVHTTPGGVFGYQDRYAEYRHHPSYVCGDFRSTLNDWHLARQFAADPALNASFVECDPSKRIFAEQTEDSLWAMFSHSIQARRLVGNRTIGRII